MTLSLVKKLKFSGGALSLAVVMSLFLVSGVEAQTVAVTPMGLGNSSAATLTVGKQISRSTGFILTPSTGFKFATQAKLDAASGADRHALLPSSVKEFLVAAKLDTTAGWIRRNTANNSTTCTLYVAGIPDTSVASGAFDFTTATVSAGLLDSTTGNGGQLAIAAAFTSNSVSHGGVAKLSLEASGGLTFTQATPLTYTGFAQTFQVASGITIGGMASGFALSSGDTVTSVWRNNINAVAANATRPCSLIIAANTASKRVTGQRIVPITIGKATLTQSTYGSLFDTTALHTALVNTSKSSGGVPLVLKTPVDSMKLSTVLKLDTVKASPAINTTKFGAVSFQYRKVGASSGNWGALPVTDTGTYNVSVVISGGDNVNALAVGNVVMDSVLKVGFGTLNAQAAAFSDTTMSYTSLTNYTIRGPVVYGPATFGTIDTVIYENPEWTVPGAKTPPTIRSVAAKGANVTIATGSDTGTILYTVTIRGKTPIGVFGGGTVWSRTKDSVKAVIQPKKLSSNGINVVNFLNPIIYGDSVVADPQTFLISDGSLPLGEGSDYKVVPATKTDFTKSICPDDSCNRIDAGDAYFVITGNGNYSDADTIGIKYTITKAPIYMAVSAVSDKPYDGTTTIDTSTITLSWVNYQGTNIFMNLVDYVYNSATISSATVGTGKTVTVNVAFKADGPVSKNYSLNAHPSGTAAGVGSRANVAVTQRIPFNWDATDSTKMAGDTNTFTFGIPKDHLYLGVRRGSGNAYVSLKNPMSNPGTSLTMLYNYDGTNGTADFNGPDGQVFTGDTTIVPINVGKYLVKVRMLPQPSTATVGVNIANATYILGEYEIKEGLKPVFDVDLVDRTFRQNKTGRISVTASSPNGGDLAYKWYQVGAGANGTDLELVDYTSNWCIVSTAAQGIATYYVRVSNTKSSVQSSMWEQSSNATITVIEPAIDFSKSLIVTLSKDTVTYNGSLQAISGADVLVDYFTVNTDGDTTVTRLTEITDYSFNYVSAINAGTATIQIVGEDKYEGVVAKNFTIIKRTPSASDFLYVNSNPYSGKADGAGVEITPPMSKSGAITVLYDGQAAVPIEQAVYTLTVGIAGGDNFNAGSNIFLGTYRIVKGVLDTSCFTYTIPTNHVEGVTTTFGLGTVTFAKGTGYGTLRIMYDGDTTAPKLNGTYHVAAEVSGGANYDAGIVELGKYTIRRQQDGVAQGNKEVGSGSKGEATAVAPNGIAKVSATLAVGPNPVAKSAAGKVSVYWNGSKAVKGALTVFTQVGDKVAQVKVAGVNKVGEWNVTNVPEGSYVLKGIVKDSDGNKVKVSTVITVVK